MKKEIITPSGNPITIYTKETPFGTLYERPIDGVDSIDCMYCGGYGLSGNCERCGGSGIMAKCEIEDFIDNRK